MQNKDKKTTVKNQPTKNVQKNNESCMKILGYTYGVILRVLDQTLTEKDAFEMIRAAFQLGTKTTKITPYRKGLVVKYDKQRNEKGLYSSRTKGR